MGNHRADNAHAGIAITWLVIGCFFLGYHRAEARESIRVSTGEQDQQAWPDDDSARRWESLCVEIRHLAQQHQGEVSIAIKHFKSGYECFFEENVPRPTASLIKLPVMIEAYRQAEEEGLDLAQMITVAEEDFVPGSGILTSLFSSGTTLSLRDAIHLMIAKSDNTATNLVLNRIGLEATATTMEKWGWPETKIHSLVFKRETSKFPERSERFGLGSTTAAEMLELLERLHHGQLVSDEATQAIQNHLLACDDRTKLAARLPVSVKFAHKTGAISNVRCDAGLLETDRGTVALVVLTSNNEDQSWDDSNLAQSLCADVGRKAYDFFSANQTNENQRELMQGATGTLVEDLQRTLNQRLTPSPNLAIDGDFGPATENAVRAWQKSQGLEADGIVASSTWKSLGTLVTEDDAVPEPAEVNRTTLPRSPADAASGAPFVTCKSWIIVDPESGEIIDGFEADERRDIASITKLMTAYVVFTISQEQPDLLEVEVEFSKRADNTIGSTTGIRAGERVRLRDLLYGLLLPSGNDAAVAIAEHVGTRLLAQEREAGELSESTPAFTNSDAYDRFIRAMNEAAQSLSLTETHFQNPHGLTEDHHHSSAADVAKLAQAVLQYELFRAIANRGQYGVQVNSQSGYRRNLIWKNTNLLLQQDGYTGMKTGTTSAAGACLVGLGEREDRQLLVVILGASSSDARYVDARNLFRWGWEQQLRASLENDNERGGGR